jgi:hypothetical protein
MISILKRNSSRTYSSSFGITPTILTTGFFSLNYIGLEDDHDMGVKFTHTDKKWNYSLAFFKNAEELRFGNNSDVSNSRYSYDVVSIDQQMAWSFRYTW